jgi:hypothetical protein
VSPDDDDDAGQRIVRASWAGTAVFVLSSGIAAAARGATPVALGIALLMFVAGLGCYAAALAQAVARSRIDDVSVGGLFFLMDGVAPRRVAAHLLGSFSVEVVAAVVTAGVRINSSLAFGILAPVYGLSLVALWAARHGRFPVRPPPTARRRRPPPARACPPTQPAPSARDPRPARPDRRRR